MRHWRDLLLRWKLKVVLFSNVLVKVFDRVLEVLPVLDPVKDPLAAGVRKGPVDPDVDALVIANVNLHEVVGSSHNLEKNNSNFMIVYSKGWYVIVERYSPPYPLFPNRKHASIEVKYIAHGALALDQLLIFLDRRCHTAYIMLWPKPVTLLTILILFLNRLKNSLLFIFEPCLLIRDTEPHTRKK